MAISFVAATNNVGSGTSYTCTKPSGVANGDFLVAVVSISHGNSSQANIGVLPGWTKVRDVFAADSFATQVAVFTKVATGAEPSSWSGSISSTRYLVLGQVSAYRGVTGILAESASVDATSGTSFNSPTLNNTKSGAWSVTAGAMISHSNTARSTNETVQRADGSSGLQLSSTLYLQQNIWDSAGTIPVGNTTRSFGKSTGWDSAVVWVGILDAGDQPVSGSVAVPIPSLSPPSFDGGVFVPAALSLSLPSLGFSGVGEGAPQDSSGTMTCQLPMFDVPFEGFFDVVAVMEFSYLPVVQMRTETKPSGDRVYRVERESRGIIIFPDDFKLGTKDLTGLFTVGTNGVDIFLPMPIMSASAGFAPDGVLDVAPSIQVGIEAFQVPGGTFDASLPQLDVSVAADVTPFGTLATDLLLPVVDLTGGFVTQGTMDVSLPLLGVDVVAEKGLVVFAANVGDGSTTTFTVTHNLGSRDVLVGVYESASPYTEVEVEEITRATTNSVSVKFTTAPTTDQYRVVVVYG